MASYEEIKLAEGERKKYHCDKPATLIVLGAGASFQCLGHTANELLSAEISALNATQIGEQAKWKLVARNLPPLTSGLTQSLRAHSTGCDQLVDLIEQYQRKASEAGTPFDFEQTLKKIYEESNSRFPEAFLSLRKAIAQRMRLADKVGEKTNTLYTTLFSRILYNSAFEGRELAVLNMNYDRLAEFALTDKKGIAHVRDFTSISRPWNLYHPHGNCSWSISNGTISNGLSIPMLEDEPEGLKLYGGYKEAHPALALPMYGDPNGKLVLPEQHKKHLDNQLPNVDQIIVIGWRGADEEIVELVLKGIDLTKLKDIHIVGTSSTSIETIQNNLEGWCSNSTEVETYHSTNAFRDYLEDSESPINKIFPI